MTMRDKDYGTEVAKKFVEAINNEDASTFWSLLDRQGQGYFIGMWFYVLGDASVNAIMQLTKEKSFLDNTLGPIIKNLKENLGDNLDQCTTGEIIYIDDVHAKIPIITPNNSSDPGEADYIPLILELTPLSGDEQTQNSGEINFTCWKIDTLKCIQVQKV
ncbi:hypothetical protein [Desulfolucanica intricata]|uniref:hypothetical protein n=1 Tax=Desulfolucanica intricata TaxID=1285191 RepID=UPI00082E8CE3|nr:hypothetical protein [Desulfolucanica intricata]